MHYACVHNLGELANAVTLAARTSRSVMPLAQEAHKPMFALNRADGATSGHARAVSDCCQRDLPEELSQMHLVPQREDGLLCRSSTSVPLNDRQIGKSRKISHLRGNTASAAPSR